MDQHPIAISKFIADITSSPISPWASLSPWELAANSSEIVRRLIMELDPDDYRIMGEIAIHSSAHVEAGAVLKGPLILERECSVAAGAYLRGGNWVGQGCTLGPGTELKSSLLFPGTKLAHFNFVGDSILGSDVNCEAGSIVCNYRNERSDKEIQVRAGDVLIRTGCLKFGALIGDHCRIGANAVLAPGAILPPSFTIDRASVFDGEQPMRWSQCKP